jgi:hypothetical protein
VGTISSLCAKSILLGKSAFDANRTYDPRHRLRIWGAGVRISSGILPSEIKLGNLVGPKVLSSEGPQQAVELAHGGALEHARL